MFVYIAAPYMPGRLNPKSPEGRRQIEDNIKRANEAALVVAELGHTPFLPHTMMKSWEDEFNVSREEMVRLCHAWLRKCDALLFVSSSPGADEEKRIAEQLGMPICHQPSDLLKVSPDSRTEHLQSQRIRGYLTEYEQCMESYRHTYATIWQAGSVFTAIAAAVLVWGAESSLVSNKLPMIIAVSAGIWLFWWQGIFRPMNRYGEKRKTRLAEIEHILSLIVPGLQMQHYKVLSSESDESAFSKLFSFFVRPKVHYAVNALGIVLLVVELYVTIRLFSHWLM